ncbi:hypothetical protein HY933_01310 [Candidatus Falkowbacteria bacterium]|nr:hypothetical protein [Candidatus Falkowbacteria bacterium]
MGRKTLLMVALIVVLAFLGLLGASTFYFTVWPLIIQNRAEQSSPLPSPPIFLDVSQPLDINPVYPYSGETVTVTATIPQSSFIDVVFLGSGCGTLDNSTGKSPLVVIGVAPTNGYCHIKADGYLTTPNPELTSPLEYETDFEVRQK